MNCRQFICLIAALSLHFSQWGVDCESSVSVFSGNAKEFKKKFNPIEGSKVTIVSFNDKGYALKTSKELAEKLEGFAEVVAVNCKDEEKLCTDLKVDSNSYYVYPKGVKYTGDERTSAQLAAFVMETGATLYDISNMDSFYREVYQTFLHQRPAWLVSYCFNETEAQDASDPLNKDLNCFSSAELRKIAMALSEKIKVAQLNCDKSQEICNIAKPKRSRPLVLYSYFPGLQALYSLKDGATTIEKIRDLIQQDEVVSSDFKEIVAMIPAFIEGQERNENFFDPRVMKTRDQVIAEKAEKKAAKKAAEEAAENRVDDATATQEKTEL
jgi:hypothetical protein